jgi:hypothetical protein
LIGNNLEDFSSQVSPVRGVIRILELLEHVLEILVANNSVLAFVNNDNFVSDKS